MDSKKNGEQSQQQVPVQNHQNDLVHPIPQRRYAFIFANEEPPHQQQSAPLYASAMDGLIRPVSAPAGFHQQQQQQAGELANLERPSSPLSRVTNPMVRDYHFRRGFAVNNSSIHHVNVHTPRGVSSIKTSSRRTD